MRFWRAFHCLHCCPILPDWSDWQRGDQSQHSRQSATTTTNSKPVTVHLSLVLETLWSGKSAALSGVTFGVIYRYVSNSLLQTSSVSSRRILELIGVYKYFELPLSCVRGRIYG